MASRTCDGVNPGHPLAPKVIRSPLWPWPQQCPISAPHHAQSCDNDAKSGTAANAGRRPAKAFLDLRRVSCRHRGRPKAGEASRSSRCPTIPTRPLLADVEAKLATFPPLVFAGEARQLKKALGRRGRGRWLPAPGRRLRRKLPGASRRQHPRFLPRVPADGGGADVCRRLAGGEGRPHRRPVRQAALLADREEGRRGAAELSRRHHQRLGVHAGGAHARSAAAARGLPPVGGDAEPDPRLRPGRLCRPGARAPVDAGLRQGQPAGPSLRGAGRAASPRR